MIEINSTTEPPVLHTAAPWRVQEPQTPEMPACIYGLDDSVRRCGIPSRGIGENEVEVAVCYGHERGAWNAAFIVKAVNCHEEMLAALKAHDAYMFDAGYSGSDSDALHPKAAQNWRAIRAAIAKAEGRTA